MAVQSLEVQSPAGSLAIEAIEERVRRTIEEDYGSAPDLPVGGMASHKLCYELVDVMMRDKRGTDGSQIEIDTTSLPLSMRSPEDAGLIIEGFITDVLAEYDSGELKDLDLAANVASVRRNLAFDGSRPGLFLNTELVERAMEFVETNEQEARRVFDNMDAIFPEHQ